jgi:hypothetical protein
MSKFGKAIVAVAILALPNTIFEEEMDDKKSNYDGFVHFDGKQLLCS